MFVPHRRTVMVLVVLIGAMTLCSGLLLALEPRPTVPGPQIVLSSIETAVESEKALFATRATPGGHRWTTIVIQQSGAATGSAESLNKFHERVGLGGLAYHFVIGNGQGMPDGQVEAGFRWDRQLRGTFNPGMGIATNDPGVLGICLIGDGRTQAPTQAQLRELVWLVRKLQEKFSIPVDRVVLQTNPQVVGGVSRLFPIAGFRQQLLAGAMP